ncbi:MAG: PAS domain S-box protein [Actinomycetota bacterium]
MTTPYRRSGTQPRSIRQHMLMAVMAPALALVAFSGWIVVEKLALYRHSADLLAAARVVGAARAMASQLQAERTLSLMAAGRRDAGLATQRSRTDAEAAVFSSVLSVPETAALFGSRSPDAALGRLAELRARADAGGEPVAVMAGYNEMVGRIIGASAKLSGEGLGNLVAAYIDLGHVEDRINRVQAIGASWLAGRRVDRALLGAFIEADAEKHAFLESFRNHLPPSYDALYDDIDAGRAMAEVDRMEHAALAGEFDRVDPIAWSTAYGELSSQIAQLEHRLADDMEGDITVGLDRAKAGFWIMVVTVLALTGLSIEAIRRSERRAWIAQEEARTLFRAVEQSPVAVMISDPAGTIEYINPAFTRMTGYQREEVVGRTPRILKSGEMEPSVYADLWQTISGGNEWRGEMRNRRRDGSLYWESMTVAPVRRRDGAVINYIAMKEDISEVKSLRQGLEREHDNLRRALAAIHDGIALVTTEGGFSYVNPALEAEFGPVDGRDCRSYFEDHGPDCPSCVDCEAGAEPHRHEWHSAKTGKVYELTDTPVLTADGSTLMLQLFHDITVRKQAEEALLAAREAAELNVRSKGEFLAAMSHELRTPLNAIIGFSEIIESELLGPIQLRQYVEYAHDINESGKHLLQLINDILDISRIEVGRVTLREEMIDPGALMRAAMAMVRERAQHAEVALIDEIPLGLPALWADERRVKQALVNILANAVKFTPPGGRVTASAAITVNGDLDLVVEDTGIGIAAEDIERAMRPFEQVDSGLGRRFGGTGLGLPLTRQLMDLHGARVLLDSELGHGTRACLRFPPERIRRSAAA